MTELHKISLIKFCFALMPTAFCMLLTLKGEARYTHKCEIYSTLTTDTIPPTKKDTLRGNIIPDSSSRATDTLPPTTTRVDNFVFKYSKDTLDAPVNYEALDSGVLLVKEKKFLLYGTTKTTYKDVIMTAPSVELDQETNILTAVNARDSMGNIIARAKFEQGTEGFQSDTIRYNFKTQKGLTKNTFTKPQGELFVQASLIKKVNANTTFAKRVIMTTCDYDDPHFGFVASKGKFITNKVAITGPVHPEFEGVPIPVYLPFGFFPLKQGRHSGLLFGNIDINDQWGIGLLGLGYYQVLNQNLDAAIRANIYSYGGWSVQGVSQYIKKYHYNGTFSLNVMHNKYNFKGDPDYRVQNAFQINWSHAANIRARGRNFSASVQAGSSRYNEELPSDPNRNFQNQLSSSISYAKTWPNKPYNLTLAATHSQNNLTRDVRITLPNAAFTVMTIKPFEKKDLIGTAPWWREIGIGYSGNLQNQVAFYDTAKNTLQSLLDTMQWGAQHNFPISINIPQNSNIKFSPFVSYSQTWLTTRLIREWNETAQKVDTISDKKGLFLDHMASFGFSLNTALFGTHQFKKSKRLIAIRHVIRPSASFSYKPDMSKKYYDVIQSDTSGTITVYPQIIPGRNLYSGYALGKFGGINFGIDNNIELKKRGKKDTAGAEPKKIRLIDGFEMRSGYNFLADSLKWLPVSMNLRMTLFQKVNISASGTLNFYQQDSVGHDINRYAWQGNHFSLGRLNAGSISMSTNFQSKPRDPSKAKKQTVIAATDFGDPNMMAERERLQDYVWRNPAEFEDFNIPWSLSLSFSMVFDPVRENNKTVKTNITAYSNFTGSFSLTPKWKFNSSANVDFNLMQVTSLTMSISRDMHCWQMSIGVIPIGNFRSFNISINPKSSILQDLKLNRVRTFSKF